MEIKTRDQLEREQHIQMERDMDAADIAGVSMTMIADARYCWKHAPKRMQAILDGTSEEDISAMARGIRLLQGN